MTNPDVLRAARADPFVFGYECTIERNERALGHFTLLDDMIVERGDKSDWDLLHDLHYKAENLPIGPRFWKLTLYGETIGVIVTGNPKGLLKERHIAFPSIKPTGRDTNITNTQRYRYINRNIRVISRFVIDTMYRGIGAGYMMMNLAARMEGMKIIEIQSSMSKFNHFGQKAGFKFVTPMNANKYEQGLKFFRSRFKSSPQDFESIIAEIDSISESQRLSIIKDCKEFYGRHSASEKTGAARIGATARIEAMTIRYVIKGIQQMTLASPMYGVFINPDLGRELPYKLSLNQFKLQKPNEPLRLEK